MIVKIGITYHVLKVKKVISTQIYLVTVFILLKNLGAYGDGGMITTENLKFYKKTFNFEKFRDGKKKLSSI